MKKGIILFAFVLATTNCILAQGYCVPTPISANFYISKVIFGTLNKTTVDNGYSDYSGTDTAIVNYGSNAISITGVGASLSMADDKFVYIDWDQDSIFDASESFYFPFSINVPGTVAPGAYRMRVSMGLHNTHHALAFPCLSDTGEVEDYTIVVQSPVSINENSTLEKDLVIAPNPSTSGVFNLSFNTSNINISFEVFDGVGRTILSKTLDSTNNVEVDLSAFQKGTYTIRLNVCNTIITKKLVIN